MPQEKKQIKLSRQQMADFANRETSPEQMKEWLKRDLAFALNIMNEIYHSDLLLTTLAQVLHENVLAAKAQAAALARKEEKTDAVEQ